MSKTETEEFATASDLVAPSLGEKEITLKTLDGKKVVIKKINIGELSAVIKTAKDDEIFQYVLLCFKGLVRPVMNIDECKKLPLKVVMELSSEITKFSELDKDSLKRIRNLLVTVS